MTPLRATIEEDLATTLQGDFAAVDAAGVGLVTLVAPNGDIYSGLKGQVLYDQRTLDPETGVPVITHLPVVTLRKSSLARVPAAGERWHVRIPLSPVVGSAMGDFLLSADRAPEGSDAVGFVRLYLQRASQGAEPPPPPEVP